MGDLAAFCEAMMCMMQCTELLIRLIHERNGPDEEPLAADEDENIQYGYMLDVVQQNYHMDSWFQELSELRRLPEKQRALQVDQDEHYFDNQFLKEGMHY